VPNVDWGSSDCTSTTVWYTWTCDQTTSSNTGIWADWTTSGTSATITGNYVSDIAYEPPTPEQIAEQQRQADEWRRQAEERERERVVAAQRAEQLLRDNLSPAQLAEYEQHGHFHVRGESARYRIRKGRSANIDVLEGERVAHRLCIHPAEQVPDQDTMLAQKLALEADEPGVLRLANRHAA
jgi:hypothetical protein